MKKFILTGALSFLLGGLIMFIICKKNINMLGFAGGSKSPREAFTGIDVSKARRYVTQYNQTTIPPVPTAGRPSRGNTLTVWYDIHTISQLLTDAQEENGTLDGVRLYFATYDSDYTGGVDSRGNRQDYSSANTIILVPTATRTIKGINYHWDMIDTTGVKQNTALIASAENKGELCPPPSNCKTIGALLLK